MSSRLRGGVDGPEDDSARRLLEKLRWEGLTVWATLVEDGYETFFGDGYYAHLDQVFMKPSEAGFAVEAAEAGPNGGYFHWHVKRYDLKRFGDRIEIRPGPTEREPVTIEDVARKLAAADLI